MSRKQEIYLRLFGAVLPLFRNVQSQPWWRRLASPNLFLEAELVHKLPKCLIYAEFTEEDVWWMNAQARLYCEKADAKRSPFYDTFLPLIAELFVLVPEVMRTKLNWLGPDLKN